MARSFDRRAVVQLATAHLVNDVNQSAVLGLVPFLVAQRGLSYAAASGVVMALQLSGIVQPVLGHRADARPSRVAIPVTLIAGATAVAAIGLVGNDLLFAAVLLAGLATAAFHPEATRLVRAAAGGRTSTALGVFTLGGNLGTAIGPVVAAALVGAFGWVGPCVLVMPAIGLAWWVRDRAPGTASRALPRTSTARLAPPRWAAFARCVAILVLRAGTSGCITAFAPLYLMRAHGWQPGTAGLMLTIALLLGVAAGVLAGPLAERWGRRRVLLISLAPLGPLLVGFAVLPGGAAILCLLLAGAVTMPPYVVGVVAAQDCLPGREGLAAGVAMGVGTALGSVAVVIVGQIAEATGLFGALMATAVLPVVAALLAARRS